MKKIALSLGLFTMILGTAACNTVRGVGDDLTSAADAVDEET